jgi:elongation factor P
MALTSEITRGMIVLFNNEPCIVIDKEFYSPGKGGSFTRTKFKNIKTGKIFTQTIRSGEKLDQLEIETKTMQYLYADEKEAYFMDPISFDQISIPLDMIEGGMDYLHVEAKYIVILYEGQAISVQLPSKIGLVVAETSEAVKGNTSGNATKEAIMETGAKVFVPLFIKQGDKILINTETRLYVSKEN